MNKAEQDLRERALTLFSTGRYSTRQMAYQAALTQQRKEELKKKEKQTDSKYEPDDS